jgi:flagellar hook-associated protein 2
MPGFNSIDGISSGLDTSGIIDAIIQYERRNVVLLEYDQAEKTNIVSTLQAFQAKLLGLKTSVAQIQARGTFEQATIDISDEDYISASASGSVSTGSYNLQVLSIARNHQIASQGFSNESLSSFGTGTLSIGVGDATAQTIIIDTSNNSLVGIKKAINDANAGVTATIISDGSSSNPYRLLLTADKTGLENQISITSSLSGGSNLNYSTATFDSPELLNMDSGSSSLISVGASAAYTGSVNKIYTFTVDGTGSQTVGTDNITINWSDGTDSGAIVVTQADTEFDLVGVGSEGLKLSFASGTLTEGDTFQVATFAPLLQGASDARISVGSGGGTGSPITITSDTNKFKDVIGNVELTVKKETTAGQFITINTDVDIEAIKGTINSFIDQFNAMNKFVDDQNTYDQDTKESGVLFGDYAMQSIQSSLRRAMSSQVTGLISQYNQLYSIGIRTGLDGDLAIKDSARLEEALRENVDDVMRLFADSGTSDHNNIEFISSTSDTAIVEDMEVDITQVATHGTLQGIKFAEPESLPLALNSSNNRLKLILDGLTSDELVLTEKIYSTTSELVTEIQSKIDNDDRIGNRGLTVEWVDVGGNEGYLKFTSSTWGSNSSVSIAAAVANSALAVLGLADASGNSGDDVEGTINGEEAEGRGQYLTGKDDNDTTDGLKLKITLDNSQLVSGAEGTISISKGVGAKLEKLLISYTKTDDGMVDRKIKSYKDQISDIEDRIAHYDELLVLRRERLEMQYQKMEQILGQLGAQSAYLTAQVGNMNANWNFNQSG